MSGSNGRCGPAEVPEPVPVGELRQRRGALVGSGYADQAIYLKALVASGTVDHIAYGSYVARVKYAPLAVRAASRSGAPQLVHPQWPIMVQDAHGNAIPNATFMVSYAHREEKGS